MCMMYHLEMVLLRIVGRFVVQAPPRYPGEGVEPWTRGGRFWRGTPRFSRPEFFILPLSGTHTLPDIFIFAGPRFHGTDV